MNLQEIATKADIESLRNEVLKLMALLSTANVEKKVLRSADVKNILGISDSTLQRLRVSSKLKANNVNGTWFYKLSDIQKLMGD